MSTVAELVSLLMAAHGRRWSPGRLLSSIEDLSVAELVSLLMAAHGGRWRPGRLLSSIEDLSKAARHANRSSGKRYAHHTDPIRRHVLAHEPEINV